MHASTKRHAVALGVWFTAIGACAAILHHHPARGAGGPYYINPNASPGGNGSITSPFNAWPQPLTANTTYYQLAGTTSSSIAVTVSGVVMGMYGTGALPIIQGIYFQSTASNDTMSNFEVSGYGGVGVTMNGATQITIENCVIQNNANFGISDQGGGSNTFKFNLIDYNGNGGIEISNLNSNGGDTVSYNWIIGNGTAGSGYSGIHTFSPSASYEGWGNTISYNIIENTQPIYDATTDGNGIEIDTYTQNNVANYNLTVTNAAAGQEIFEASNNTIDYGVAMSNGNTTATFDKQEFVCDYDGIGASGNTISNSIAIPGYAASFFNTGCATVTNFTTGAGVHAAIGTWLTNFAAGQQWLTLTNRAHVLLGNL